LHRTARVAVQVKDMKEEKEEPTLREVGFVSN